MSLLRNLFSRRQGSLPAGKLNQVVVPATAGDHSVSDGASSIQQARSLSLSGDYAAALRQLAQCEVDRGETSGTALVRGVVLVQAGRHIEAHAAFERARRLVGFQPDTSDLREMGWAAFHSGHPQIAQRYLHAAVDTDSSPRALFALGIVEHATGQFASAAKHFEAAASIEATPESLNHAGGCQLQLRRPDLAEMHFRRATELFPENPLGWTNLGVALDRLDRDEEAQAAFARAEELERSSGDEVGATGNLAVHLRHINRHGEALATFARLAGRAKPSERFNLALALATVGRLSEAWRHHEFRWAHQPMLDLRAGLGKPAWTGQSLESKTLLIRAEQGFGDTIQFLRYVPWLKALGANVVVRVQKGLESLAVGFSGVDRVLGGNEPNPEFDFYVHPMSLPLVFGTGEETIPQNIPYLAVAEDVIARWRARVKVYSGLKVGLVWAGSKEHQRDAYRSIPLIELQALFALSGVAWFSLQKPDSSASLAPYVASGKIIDLATDLDDFVDTAAAILALDLVVSVDTAVAHLAGALGKPVWIMVASSADWRWMTGRSDSPWYPSMRVFRQSKPRSWSDVVSAIYDALKAEIATPGRLDLSKRIAPPLGEPRITSPLRSADPEWPQVTEARYGIIQFDPTEPIVGASMAMYGEYYQRELVSLMQYVQPGSVVVEGSAGIGAHTLGLSLQVGPAGHILVYEDDPRERRLLVQNLIANRPPNVTLMERNLVASPTSEVSFADERLDDLMLDRLDWIKLAGRAASVAVLEGGRETIWRYRPRVFVTISGPDSLGGIAGALQSLGYRCWKVSSPAYNPDNFNCRRENHLGEDVRASIIAFPEEAQVQLALSGAEEIAPVA